MIKSDATRLKRAGVWGAIALVSSILVVLVAQRVLDLSGELVLVTVLIIPLVVFGVIAGVLEEISGPGGWKAKFRATARRPAEFEAQLEVVEFIGKGPGGELYRRLRTVSASSTPILVLRFPTDIQYDPWILREYVEALTHHPWFRFVVVLDEAQRLVGHTTGWSLLRAIEDDAGADDRFPAIGQGRLFEVVERLPDPPTRDITRRKALREMERQGIDALLVVDESRRILGVLSREMVLSQLMLALAED
jgi:CBS domain-containing protein